MGRKAKLTTDPLRAVAYLRVSTEDQNLGPDAQRAAIERWAITHGVAVVAVHVDQGVSGGAPIEQRPALMAAIDALRANAAGLLVVAKRDRLARDMVVAAMIERLAERSGARVASADGVGEGSGPEAFMLRAMMDVFAQYERLVIRARTRAALSVKKGRGERVGHVPFGYRLAEDGRQLIEDPNEQRALARAHALRAEGTTYQRILDTLSVEGHAPRGRRWHLATVHGLLNRDKKAA